VIASRAGTGEGCNEPFALTLIFDNLVTQDEVASNGDLRLGRDDPAKGSRPGEIV